MKNKLYLHEGLGHYIGSTVLVYAESMEKAEIITRKELDSVGLGDESLNIRELKLEKNKVLLLYSGDY